MSTTQEPSYWPDPADEIDTEAETVADMFGVSLETANRIIAFRDSATRRDQAEILARIIGLLLRAKNLPVMLHSLALSFGLEALNGAHSQAEIARSLGCTRALISHYVVGWRDVLEGGTGHAFDCTKFRKSNAARATYAKSATSPIVQRKRKTYPTHKL